MVSKLKARIAELEKENAALKQQAAKKVKTNVKPQVNHLEEMNRFNEKILQNQHQFDTKQMHKQQLYKDLSNKKFNNNKLTKSLTAITIHDLSDTAKELIGRKHDYIHTNSKSALIKLSNSKDKKTLNDLIYVLQNIEHLGAIKIQATKIHSLADSLRKLDNNVHGKVTKAFNGSALDITYDCKVIAIDHKKDPPHVIMDYPIAIDKMLSDLKRPVQTQLFSRIDAQKNLKVYFTFTCELFKEELSKDKFNEMEIKTITSTTTHPAVIINNHFDASKLYESLGIYFTKLVGTANHNSSGWRFAHTIALEVKTAIYKPLHGKSYIRCPAWIENKKCIVNVKNDDEQCFKWAVLSCVCASGYKLINPKRQNEVSQYTKHEDMLDFSGIKYPTSIDDIKLFEKKNPTYAVFVFVIDDDKSQVINPYYVHDNTKGKTLIKLLLLQSEKNNHYVWIKNFGALLRKFNAHHVCHWCYKCLHHFPTVERLTEHENNGCNNHGACKISMPPPDSVVKFTNHGKSLKVPFVYYADFESFLVPIETVSNSNNVSWTENFQKHIPASFCIYRVCVYDSRYNKMYMYDKNSNNNVIEDFLSTLKASVIESELILKNKKDMVLTDDDIKNYTEANCCHICKEKIDVQNVDNCKVRDHDHITGKYRGAAHKKCNLTYRFNTKFPVYFHNLKGYDSHHIIRTIGNYIDYDEKLTCIPCNTEKYLTFSWNNINFNDSLQFMASSLDALASNLKVEDKKHTRINFNGLSNTVFELLTSKGIFPYDYFDGKDRFDDIALPSIEQFYSKLSNTKCSERDYAKAKIVWDSLKCETFRDYHDIYLKTDVLLLADVFENFRDVCMDNYGLDPCHYITAPSIAWDAALKMTKVELQLFSDYEMYMFVERAMRGGNSMIAHRYAKANNKYMSDYNVDMVDSYIMYLDANNLYGHSMSQPLPYGNFKWESQLTADDLLKMNASGDRGCFIECDLEYPEELHNMHNSYPLAPEKLTITNDMLSPFTAELKKDLNVSDDKINKLVCTLSTKRNYVLHIRNLQLYVSLGLKLTKIHKVLTFSQKSWLKEYIDFNTNKRKLAKNPFEKDFYKLMNNSVFGKTMENVRNRINFKLATNSQELEKFVSKISYKSHVIFGDSVGSVVGVQQHKMSCVLDKPIYVGASILDLSKTLMYDFHYNTILKTYNYNQVKLLFTDTDSLCYHIHTKDMYHDIGNDKTQYDLSDYSSEHFLHDKTNAKVIGKFKDETNGIPITEFVGLRSKMYSFTYEKNNEIHEKKTAKGIKKGVVEKDITFNNYKQALTEKDKYVQFAKMSSIRSKKHELYSLTLNKIGLSTYDNKRYVCDDNINTLAHGHKDCIKNI